MKSVNIQRVFDIPDHIKFIVTNFNGQMVGFINPPIRDSEYREWVDSVDGSTGEVIEYHRWETSLYETSRLKETVNAGMIKHREALENARKYGRKKR